MGPSSETDPTLAATAVETRSGAGPSTVQTVELGSTSVHAVPFAERYADSRASATGGTGELRLARDTQIGRSVAMKRMLARRGDRGASCARPASRFAIAAGCPQPHSSRSPCSRRSVSTSRMCCRGTFEFRDGALVIVRQMLDLPALPTLAMLTGACIATATTSALYFASVRKALRTAQEQLLLHTWHLRSMVPATIATQLRRGR